MIGYSLTAPLPRELNRLKNGNGIIEPKQEISSNTDQKDEPNCSRADFTFAADNPIPKQLNGTSFLPDFDPSVVLNVFDAIVNGDLWTDVVSGLRTVFAHWRNRLAQSSGPSVKGFPVNSTDSIVQLSMLGLD